VAVTLSYKVERQFSCQHFIQVYADTPPKERDRTIRTADPKTGGSPAIADADKTGKWTGSQSVTTVTADSKLIPLAKLTHAGRF